MDVATALKPDQLKPSSREVLEILRACHSPLSAYQILERADSANLKNPVQVYRALKVLTRLALVHRVETLNKYVPCRCNHPQGVQPVLTICDKCGAVSELNEVPSMQGLQALLIEDGFISRAVKVEVSGLCLSCQDQASA